VSLSFFMCLIETEKDRDSVCEREKRETEIVCASERESARERERESETDGASERERARERRQANERARI